jgi:hypothetical protein
MTRRFLFGLLCFALLSPVKDVSADETDEPVVEGRVVGKIWHAKVGMSDSFRFMKSVQDAMGLEQGSMVMMMPPGARRLGGPMMSLGNGGPDAAVPELKGTLIFLQTAPVANLDSSFAFELVGSHDEFVKRLKAHASQMGPAAELIGKDDRYEVKLTLKQLMAGPPPQPEGGDDDEPQVTRTFSIVIQADSAGSLSGKPGAPPAPPRSISTYYRYVDGIMYSSSLDIVHTVDLPTQENLKLDESESQNDLHADFDLSEIPIALKRAFWNALEASAGTWLQRFDDEAPGEYSLRRSVGEGRLELIRAGLFDVERVRFSLKLPQDDEQQVVANLRVTARDGSQLARTLDQLGRQRSQLSALQDESSPLVVSSSILIPEWAAPAATGIVESLRLRLREAAAEDGSLGVLIDDLMAPLAEATQSRAFDAAFSLRGSPATGLVLQSGIRLPDAEQFLSSLQTTINVLPGGQFVASPLTVDDYNGISIRSDEPLAVGEHLSIPLQMHLAATGSWLWITFGGDTAVDALADLVNHSEDQLAKRAKGMPLHIQFSLSNWLADTEDEYGALPKNALMAFERWLGQVTQPRMMMMTMQVNGKPVEFGNRDESMFKSYAGKLLTEKNSDLDIKVQTFGRELTVDATVGTGVVQFAAAQYVAAQANMFSNIPIMFSRPGGEGEGAGTRRIQIGR